MKSKVITIHGLEELTTAASQLLEYMRPNTVVALYGEMGAGKTTLIKELCRQLGVASVVSSPTFALVNEYEGKDELKIFHFDFYRINKLEEVFDFGYEEYFYSNALCLVEWPEKIAPLLPDHTLKLTIKVLADGSRTIHL